MTTFSGSARTLRGALVSIDPITLAPTVIAFQYNPTTLTRSFELRTAATGPETGQVGAPPIETIKVELELDATDEREKGGGQNGVLPKLTALQTLVTPRSAAVIANEVLAVIGTIEIAPPASPLTLFIWGRRRVLPVIVSELQITEEAHDADLTPTLAKVSLGLRVLNYNDFSLTHPGYALSLAQQIAGEVMALEGSVQSLAAVLGSDARLF